MIFKRFLAPTRMVANEDQRKLTHVLHHYTSRNLERVLDFSALSRWVLLLLYRCCEEHEIRPSMNKKSSNVRNYVSMNIMSSSSSRVFMSHSLFISVSPICFYWRKKSKGTAKLFLRPVDITSEFVRTVSRKYVAFGEQIRVYQRRCD